MMTIPLTLEIEIEPPRAGERLDAALAALLGAQGLSRSRLRVLIETGNVRLLTAPGTVKRFPKSGNRFLDQKREKQEERTTGAADAVQVVLEPDRRVKPGERYSLTLPPPTSAKPAAQEIPLSVVYEDMDLIVIDKRAGLVVHPAPGNPDLTLVNALIAHCGGSLSGIGGVARPGIVHRLDKDTSGLMVAAKTDLAHQGLAAQFAAHGRDGRLIRAYHAFVWGIPAPPAGRIDAPIGRNPKNRKAFAVTANGKQAVTHYKTLARLGPVSLIECRLETGRTHQIRVHLSNLGHPLLGDPVYGGRRKGGVTPAGLAAQEQGRRLQRQALHAAELGFVHPRTGERLVFRSSLPKDLADLRRSLERL